MDPLVVDSSVAAKWFVREEHAGFARRVLDECDQLHAPHFFLVEMHNIICKWIRRGDIGRDQGDSMRAAQRVGPSDPPCIRICRSGLPPCSPLCVAARPTAH